MAEKAFADYRQGDRQSLIEYKAVCAAIGAPERDDEYLGSVFVRGLHPQFSTLLEAYANHRMGDRPVDVD